MLPVNTARPLHWSVKRQLRITLSWMVRAAHAPPKEPWEKARVTVVRHSSKKPDYGNLVESAKPLLDVLQPNSKRHPQGLGYIVDDDPEHLVEVHEWNYSSPRKGWTELILVKLQG